MTIESGVELYAARWLIVMLISSAAAISDIRTRRVPNWLTLPALFAGVAGSVFWAGTAGPLWAIAGATIVALPAFVLFVFAGGGAGDVKLLGALGSWLAFRDVIVVVICVAVASVICGILWAVFQRHAAKLLSNMARIAKGYMVAMYSRNMRDALVFIPDRTEMQTMPYCVPIFVGMCLAATERWLWQG
jgi:prepilin peptidase CpaA